MTFGFTETETVVQNLAADIFGAGCGQDRLLKVEASERLVDDQLWRHLANSGLLGLAVAEDVGGGGGSFTEQILVLEQQGKFVAPVPLAATVVAALAVDAFGDTQLRSELLPAVIAGEHVATAALASVGQDGEPAVIARPAGGAHWRLDGVEYCVPAAPLAQWLLVPALEPDGLVGLYVVTDPFVVTAAPTTDRQSHGHVRLESTPGRRLGGPECARWLLQRMTIARCAIQIGVARTAVELAAAYAGERQQFGKPLAAFQSVLMRVADALIGTDAVQATTYAAAHAATEKADVACETALAKWWASTAGITAVETALYLHGGAGNLLEHRLPRYYLWAKQNATMLGGAARQLQILGQRLAEDIATR
jgi:alkylation response protein AidB-like acyl-CoA dehydrogenase